MTDATHDGAALQFEAEKWRERHVATVDGVNIVVSLPWMLGRAIANIKSEKPGHGLTG